jgi:hypothetical protein
VHFQASTSTGAPSAIPIKLPSKWHRWRANSTLYPHLPRKNQDGQPVGPGTRSRIGCRLHLSLSGSGVLGQMHRGKRLGCGSALSEFLERLRLVRSAASDLPSHLNEGCASHADFLRYAPNIERKGESAALVFNSARGTAPTLISRCSSERDRQSRFAISQTVGAAMLNEQPSLLPPVVEPFDLAEISFSVAIPRTQRQTIGA